ncbi:MAG: transglutaminase domain-containing protein [Nitrospirota bacterium]
MFLNLKFKITKVILLSFVLNVFAPVLSPGLSAMAETVSDKDIVLETSVEQSSTVEKTENLYYSKLMREVRLIKEGKVDNTKEAKLQAINDLERFMEEEKARLDKLGVDKEKQKKYFELLELQLTDVKSQTDASLDEFEKVTEFYKETTLPLGESLDSVKESQFFDSTKDLRIENLEKPSKFYFGDEEVTVKSLSISDPGADEKISQTKQPGTLLRSLFGIGIAYAIDIQYMPVLEDLQADGEVIISSSIRDLAHDLNNNPVEIFNYVNNNINYEPYFGAKKGSVGCLQERVCNDVDTASLTIALMRAAGIPARYKKGLAVLPVEQLQNLLGVDETKTAYYVFYANNVPVYTLSGSQAGVDIDLADFTYETRLVLDWVNVEIFYDYDERGANIPNIMDLSEVATTQDLQALFADSYKKQWIPVDAAMKIYDRTQNEIVHDTANFDTMAFWLDFLQYQGDLSPIAKYIQDLLTQTGSDITLAQYQSTKEIQPRQFDVLPSSLSYILSQGTPSGGDPILMETWSQLPNDRRFQVTLSLLLESDSSVVFSNTFFGSEINNKGVDLMYQGATPADEAVIESYGGIHATPAALVDIQPYFLTDSGRYDGASSVGIGESLILQFEYSVGGNLIYTDQKYSVAGNQEGIYMVLSRVLDNPYFTDGLNDNSEILLEGNTGLAWKYIREVEKDSDLLAKTLDYKYDLEFFRAVVTQNRVLAEVGGIPTTFDFEGLTIDASLYINDYSNRGDFREHQEDFRLLLGENASYYEGQLFTDVAGLEGISTVTGLQYAYDNPGTYTVHTIDGSNESVIDTLALSANTKANMHADVQAGNTIITPDRPVVYENFDGSLYISLASDGTGTYAIGEQVSNGGWTVDDFQYASYFPPMGMITEYLSYSDSTKQVCFEDSMYGNPDLCMASWAEHNETETNNPGYQDQYGCLCSRGTNTYSDLDYAYGEVDTTYILTTNFAKFYASNGSYGSSGYWVSEQTVRNKINSVANQYPSGEKYSFWFSPVVGTYLQSFCTSKDLFTDCYDWNTGTIYYSPDSNQGEAYLVVGDFLEKLGEKFGNDNNFVVKKVGHATGIEGEAAEYPGETFYLRDTNGYYQNFINGQLYKETNWLNEMMYIPGKIAECFNNPSICGQSGGGGTGGYFGFPIGDPERGTDGSWYQSFQNEKEIHLQTNGQIEVTDLRHYRCQVYGDVTSSFKLKLYTAHGIWNGVKDVIGGVAVDLPLLIGGVIKTIGKVVFNPADSYVETKEIIQELAQIADDITWQQVWEVVNDGGDQALIAIKSEIDTAACPARESYLAGYFIGSAVSISKVISGLKWGKNLPGHFKTALLKVIKKVDKFGFRKDKLLNSHFIDHGADFNAVDASDYLNKANRFFSSLDSNILVKIRKKDTGFGGSKGDIIKYDPLTDEFAVLSQDGFFRTYFKPVPLLNHKYNTNLEYFNAQ